MNKLLQTFAATELARYRWTVLWRVFLASAGGFLIANLTAPVLASLADEQRALLTHGATVFSFLVWLTVIMAVFSLSKTRHATLLVLGAVLLMSAVVLLASGGSQR
ncbi:hypothetical protein [Rheinheimera mangrovi]|uniref:hypothetical protein n=1 Tax=Rheinheimera mangrovi TaxID=2498451 RepID=UPI000F8C4E67|nr:hypothetical protein [Rheinheimera mangrovi]